jgi:hypothetical protein
VLKVSAQTIDASHWEWQKEQELRRRRNPAPSTSKTSDPNGKCGKPSTDNSSPKHGDSKKKKKGGRGNGGNSGGSFAQTSTPTTEKPYAKVLGPDGKLLPAEKARRLAENLCLLFGGKGHQSADCPKQKAAGRAATTSTSTPATATTPAATSQSGN